MADIRNTHATSDRNYLKRAEITGNTLITLPAAFSSVPYIVNHNLGYVPMVHVGCDFDGDDTIWNGSRVNKYTETSSSPGSLPEITLKYWYTETTLTITIENNTFPTLTGTRKIWWIIYLDYQT